MVCIFVGMPYINGVYICRYAMLVGRPPFETSTLKETYMRITANKYHIPSHLSAPAKNLIQKLLNPEPSLRPVLDKILQHEFFHTGYIPKSLPTTCCDAAPKFTFVTTSQRYIVQTPHLELHTQVFTKDNSFPHLEPLIEVHTLTTPPLGLIWSLSLRFIHLQSPPLGPIWSLSLRFIHLQSPPLGPIWKPSLNYIETPYLFSPY